MKIPNCGNPEIEEVAIEDTDTLDTEVHKIIVYNDDVNSFEWVIQSLIEICKHTMEQAEQCSLLIHFKGKCDVKTGTFNKLRPMAEGLIDRGINATIE